MQRSPQKGDTLTFKPSPHDLITALWDESRASPQTEKLLKMHQGPWKFRTLAHNWKYLNQIFHINNRKQWCPWKWYWQICWFHTCCNHSIIFNVSVLRIEWWCTFWLFVIFLIFLLFTPFFHFTPNHLYFVKLETGSSKLHSHLTVMTTNERVDKCVTNVYNPRIVGIQLNMYTSFICKEWLVKYQGKGNEH